MIDDDQYEAAIRLLRTLAKEHGYNGRVALLLLDSLCMLLEI